MRMLPSNLQAQKPTDTPNDRDIGIGVLRELREKLGEIIWILVWQELWGEIWVED